MKNTSLIIGNVSTGKTKTIFNEVKSMIENNENIIINDEKKEYYKTFMPILKQKGYNTYFINFKEAIKSNGFNPLTMPYKLYKSGNKDLAIDQINDIAKELFKNDNAVDPFWQDSASDYFKGLILLLFEIGKEEEINLGSVSMMVLQIEKTASTIEKFREYLETFEFTNPIYILLSGTIFAPQETRGGIISVLKIELNKYVTKENLLNLLCYNDLLLGGLTKKNNAIFVVSDEKTNRLFNILIDELSYSDISFSYVLDNIDSLISINSLNELIKNSKIYNNKVIIGTRNIEELNSRYKFNIREKIENIIELKNNEVSAIEIGNYDEYPILNSNKNTYFNIMEFLNR